VVWLVKFAWIRACVRCGEIGVGSVTGSMDLPTLVDSLDETQHQY